MSYLPDVAYDIVGQDLRCRMSTTSYVMTYDIDIRHRMCPTYDVVTNDVHTISSKRTMSYVQTTMSYGFHRMRNRRLNQLHRMRHRIRCLHCFAPAAARGIRIRIAVFCARHLTAFCIAVFLLQCIAHNSSRHRFCRAAAWAAAAGSAGSAAAAPPDASPSSSSSRSDIV